MAYRKYTHTTETEFETVKALQKAGLSNGQIKTITKRSYWVIALMTKSDTYTGYKETVSSYKNKTRQPQVAVEEADQADDKAESPSYLASIDEMLILSRRACQANERQAAALERMADAWEAAPKRKLF